MISKLKVDFEPVGRRGKFPPGLSLLEISRRLGVGLLSICGGAGTCGRCMVQILDGKVTSLTSLERKRLSQDEIFENYRLACQIFPLSDLKVRVPPESLSAPQRTQVEGLAISVVPDPAVRSFELKLTPPSLGDLGADGERVIDALKGLVDREVYIDIDILRSISTNLRSWRWHLQASVRDGEIISLSQYPTRQLGLAVDIGTTKLAAYILDLGTGRQLASEGMMNPQIAYGEDIISRMALVQKDPDRAELMAELIVEALNGMVGDLCAKISSVPAEIVDMVVVGNTAMHHLMLRLPVEQLALSPYVPAIKGAMDVKARDIGIRIAPGAYLHLLPNIAGFVGSDHVAMLLSTEVWKRDELVLALDIGTNTEVCLSDHGKMTSVSCASGPAFEGAHITHGMRAAAGAIERLRIVDNGVKYHTIGEAEPVGICGSGILDVLAQLYLKGIVDKSGRMQDHRMVREIGGEREFVIVGENERDAGAITITQKDVRELQLAKGAIRAGIEILLDEGGRLPDEIDRVVIAGAFGTFIEISSAVAIGMFPSLPLERFEQVGNAAGAGAQLGLISLKKRKEASELAEKIDYIELASVPSFMSMFSKAALLGEI